MYTCADLNVTPLKVSDYNALHHWSLQMFQQKPSSLVLDEGLVLSIVYTQGAGYIYLSVIYLLIGPRQSYELPATHTSARWMLHGLVV